MNWVDLLVLGLAIVAAISGARQGAVIAVPALIGVVLGAIAGVRLAPWLVAQVADPVTKVVLAVVVAVFLIALGEGLGVWIGRKVRQKINLGKFSWLDSSFGALVQGAAVFVVAWLVALPLTSVSGLPSLASAVNNSAILGGVNSVMPEAAQGLPEQLRKLLLDDAASPSIVDPFQRQPISAAEPPDTALQSSAVVQQVRSSVVKIRGNAESCSRSLEGTGFVISPRRVMTNAHVVAGTSETVIETSSGRLSARVVYFDPQTDVAILSVPRLTAEPLEFAPTPARAGDSGIVLGYPLDGPYTATAARVRERITLRGPDIYGASTVSRDVFTLRAPVRSGNSGGPLIDPQGRVTGVIFGASVEDPETGFALTAAEVQPEVQAAPNLEQRVSTGTCTS